MPKWGHVEWQVSYQPGRLEAKAYDANGNVLATDSEETTGPPAALRLIPNTFTMPADGEEVSLIEVDVVDAAGHIVPTANNIVHFYVQGAGHIAGVGNGDPSCHEPNKADYRSAFNGRCMVVVQAGETPGKIVLQASAHGVRGATITLKTTPSAMK